MNKSNRYPHILRILILMMCSLSFLMMTAGKCNKARINSVYYTVTFNANGGSAVDSVRVASGSKVTKPTDPTRANYIFDGWYNDQALMKAFDFNTPITNNITLYAKWTSSLTTYTVTFNSNGGSPVSTETINAGNKAIKPADPTRTGYTFAGWYLDNDIFKQTFDFNTLITANIVLYAKWESLIKYKVIFNSNGGTPVPPQTVALGDKAIKPTDPTNINLAFDGWYLDDVIFKQSFDFNTTITANITLYAKWVTPSGDIPKLSDIITNGKIPADLSNYDIVSQQVLAPYPAGAKLSAIYITETGAGTKNGTSWANAKPKDSLKTSIDNISDANNNNVYIILIGAGTYIPGSSIKMKNNVAIVGGFSMAGGWTRNVNDITNISGNDKYQVFYNDDININNTALLYGVKIINGNGLGNGGGGMFNAGASPTITNVIFSNNNGGAMYNAGASPTITNVIFSANNNIDGGGAMYIDRGVPSLTNVVFSNNSTGFAGGGLNIYNSAPILTNVLFINNTTQNNTSQRGGGGLTIQNASPILVNAEFINNTALNANGGGIYNDNSSSPVIVNAIFWGNTAKGTDPQYNLKGSVDYSVVQDSSRATLSPTNPMLSGLTYTPGYFMPTVSYTGTSPDNLGVYVKRTKTAPYTLYYSTDGNHWYTDPTKIGTGTAASVPADAVDLTATDIQGRPRGGRPNAGVWAK